MDLNDRNINVTVPLWALLIGLVLTAGCDTTSTPTKSARANAIAETDPLTSLIGSPPSSLQRTAPPNLVQLTEFQSAPLDSPTAANGPQLVLPSLPNRSTAATSAVSSEMGGERFMVIDPPAATHSSSPREPAVELQSTDVAEQAAGTTLPWGPTTPTPEMTAIAKRAEEIARRGYDLAERGGLYSARARFTESLRIVAEALDAQRKTTAHTRALAAGLRALGEVDDFVPRGMQIESSINMPLIVDAHRTPVLKDRPLEDITPLAAQRVYLTYAQEQLAMAGGDQAVASLALHGLGKICITPAEMNGPRTQIAEAKAVVFFQAAVVIEPRNFMSANELGVLLARFGRPEDARQALEQAASSSNAPTTWRNLAIVNERLGEMQKAAFCRQRAEAAVIQSQQPGTTSGSSPYPVRWVDPATFARSNTMVPDAAHAATPTDTPTTAPAPATASKPTTKSSGWKWPWQ